MSQTAAQINQEIRDRLNRGNEIGESRVYDWMNRTKRRVQTQAEPLDFMYHEILALSGSGVGRPGLELRFDPSAIALPPNYHSLLWAKVMTGGSVSTSVTAGIFGSDVPPALFYFPTTCATGQYLSMNHVSGEQDLYPLFTNDDSFISDDVDARQVDLDVETCLSEYVSARILSNEFSSFVSSPVGADAHPLVVVLGDIYNENPNRIQVSSSMESSGYASGPWSSKIFRVMNYSTLYPDMEHRFFMLGIYRTLPDYGEPSLEARGVPVVSEDIFTRTGPDLLIEGTLELAWQYLNDDTRRQSHQVNVWGNPMLGRPNGLAYDFRKQHRTSQLSSNLSDRRRFKEGTRIERAY